MATAIPVSKIYPNPNQPRQVFDDTSLAELAESIRENGLIQPIVVEDNEDGTYTLVGGERRWRAHKLAGLAAINAEIRARSNHGGRELLVLGLVENIQRENMNPMDEAEAYQSLRDEYGMKWHEIGKAVGKHLAFIQQRAILTKYDPEIQELIRAGKFTHHPDVCRAILEIPEKAARLEFVNQARQKKMTIAQITPAAKRMSAILSAPKPKAGACPAMRLARKSSRIDFDEDTPPSGWDALQQAGSVPPWKTVSETTKAVCKACSLSSMASDVTCRECPMVDFLVKVVRQ